MIFGLSSLAFASGVISSDGTNINITGASHQIVFFNSSGSFNSQYSYTSPSASIPYSTLAGTGGQSFSYLLFDYGSPIYTPSCDTLSDCENNFGNYYGVANFTLTSPAPSSPIPSSIFYARTGGVSNASDLVASVGSATQATGASFGPMVAILGGILLAFIFITWLVSTIKETNEKTKSKKNKRI